MFERSYAWTMRHGSRILFAVALLLLLIGVANFLLSARLDDSWDAQLSNLLYGSVTPAAFLLFGAVLTDRLRRDDPPRGK